MSVQDSIKKLTRQLYPMGRAFGFPFGGVMDRLHNALSISEAQAYSDGLSILSAILPDNNDFTAADATDWERRLNIAADSSTALATRKAAIKRKMNHPGTVPYRQNYRYLEAQLQAAGFSVYVYENKFPSSPPGSIVTQTPEQVLGISVSGSAYYDPAVYYGTSIYYGDLFNHKVVNHIDPVRDQPFAIGTNYRSTFFIAGSTVSTFASVPSARQSEFRQLILSIKPLHTVAFLFVNYV